MFDDIKAVVRKDFLIEKRVGILKGRVLPLGLAILLVFGFAIPPDLQILGSERLVLSQVGPGLFWVSNFFVVLYLLDRSFSLEAEDGCLERLVTDGVDGVAFFFGKLISVFLGVSAVQAILAVAAIIMFNIPADQLGLLLVVGLVGSLALAATGTVFSALIVGAGSNQGLIAMLLTPAIVPVLLGAVRLTEIATDVSNDLSSSGWILLLLALTALYTGVGIFTFDSLLED